MALLLLLCVWNTYAQLLKNKGDLNVTGTLQAGAVLVEGETLCDWAELGTLSALNIETELLESELISVNSLEGQELILSGKVKVEGEVQDNYSSFLSFLEVPQWTQVGVFKSFPVETSLPPHSHLLVFTNLHSAQKVSPVFLKADQRIIWLDSLESGSTTTVKTSFTHNSDFVSVSVNYSPTSALKVDPVIIYSKL